MIQLVSLRPAGNKLTHVFYPIVVENVKEILKKNNEIMEQFLQQYPTEDYNLFYTVGNSATGTRDYDYQDVVVFDIDHVCLEEKETYIKLIGEATLTDPLKCGIVLTGNGIHYIIPTRRIEKEEYKILKPTYGKWCRYIKNMLNGHGLRAEVDHIFDTSRIVRMPGTRNIKPMHRPFEEGAVTRQCVVYNDEMTQEGWSIENYDVFICPKTKEQIQEEVEKVNKGISKTNIGSPSIPAPKSNLNFNPPNIEYILESCAFLKDEAARAGEGTREPLWFAMIGITAWFEDEGVTAHRLSKGHEGYSVRECDQKIERALQQSGPRSCASISAECDLCIGCRFLVLGMNPTVLRPSATTKHLEVQPAIQQSSEVSPVVEESSTPTGSIYDEWIEKGFTEKVFKDGVPTNKLKRKVVLLKDYYSELHQYIRLADVKRTVIYKDNYYQRTYEEMIKEFANKYYNPEPENEKDRLEFYKCVISNNVKTSKFIHKNIEGFINMQNGVLRVEDRVLLPHSPKYGFQYILPYAYDPDANCPNYDKLLRNICPDSINLINEYLGYCIYGGEYKYNKVLIMLGSGANGKTTLLNVFSKVVGEDNKSSIAVSDMSAAFHAVGLDGKLLNISEEENKNCFKNTGNLKKITGNTAMRVRDLFEGNYDMINRAKLILSYNTMPPLNEGDDGITRRLLTVKFPFNVLKDKTRYIKDVDKLVIAELPGIFNRALDGWDRVSARDGFEENEASDRITEEMLIDSNDLYAWANQYIKYTGLEKDKVFTRKLFEEFNTDMNLAHRYMSQGDLSKRLKEFFKRKQWAVEHKDVWEKEKHAMAFIGITLTERIDFVTRS